MMRNFPIHPFCRAVLSAGPPLRPMLHTICVCTFPFQLSGHYYRRRYFYWYFWMTVAYLKQHSVHSVCADVWNSGLIKYWTYLPYTLEFLHKCKHTEKSDRGQWALTGRALLSRKIQQVTEHITITHLAVWLETINILSRPTWQHFSFIQIYCIYRVSSLSRAFPSFPSAFSTRLSGISLYSTVTLSTFFFILIQSIPTSFRLPSVHLPMCWP